MADSVEVAASDERTARAFIEERVAERARRDTAEQVQETCSFARAERLLGREYHGRFLIELLQNAADAWREVGRAALRSRVRVVLADGPCLLVANQGAPFPETAVIQSLGHIGRSTKARGEAIGHKGIGFKSVLEISLTPELYSGLALPEPTLAVRFDPREALGLIRSESPNWDAYFADVEDIEDPVEAVPVLRYPLWVDRLPAEVRALADDGFDTVIRLPFDNELRPEPTMDLTAWVQVVRDALHDLTDQMLLLLGTFDRLEIVDRLNGHDELIEPRWGESAALDDGSTRELVTVTRNQSPTSRWRLYRRTLPETHGLSGEIAVGLRNATEGGGLVPAVSGSPSAPFHLFFPTQIGSGLPFLLHGYFEVNAARTGFYDGSAAQNGAILDELAALVGTAVADAAEQDPEALIPLADLLGEGGPPENDRARAFRERTLHILDDLAWVPIEPGVGVPKRARPTDLLVDERSELIDGVLGAFSASYIGSRTGLRIPSRRIGSAGHHYLVERRSEWVADIWEALAALCRPGPSGPWDEGEEDVRFRALLGLVTALDVRDTLQTERLLEGLRGNPESCLLPVVAPDGGRTLLPVPDPSEAVAGRRSVLVMARTRDVGGTPIVPPESMDVAFLPDGLLDSEGQVDRAKPLGVRDFTVDNVLDRMGGAASSDAQHKPVLRFLWALLVRERRGDFSTQAAVDRAVEFDAAAWFWCTPGHGGRSGPEADRQRRRRLLAGTFLPARDGLWRPAGTLAFGTEWAEWLDGGMSGPPTHATRARADAYRALDAVSPSDAAMIAPPETVLPYLEGGPSTDLDDADSLRSNMERHAFLLTLGVWEVIPVDAFESRETRNREQFPWAGPLVVARLGRVVAAGGWEFGGFTLSGGGHQNVWVAEDFRFRWSLTEAAARSAVKTAELLSTGTGLYTQLRRMAAFCPRCRSAGRGHSVRYESSSDDEYPSVLALELQSEAWAPAVLDGDALEAPQVASSVWWSERPPAGAGLRQSPLRYLRLCDPDVELSSALRDLARISHLEAADLEQVDHLLRDLREGFDASSLPVAPDSSNSARQAFIGLHRLAYERLHELVGNDPDAASDLLTQIGILCDVGEGLGFVSPPADARHDDGRFAAYRRYFTGRVPFATLARDRPQIATGLGIPAFIVSLDRRPSETSRDVTDEVADLLAERIPELLAIVVHHSLGTQTLEPTSQQFEERARRLRNLRVLQVDDLVVDARVEGTHAAATLGEGSDQDLFLEGAATSHPVLYHDLGGDGWKDALRRKASPHLAALVDNPAYAATFKILLLAETDAEREEVLQDLGISADDVDAIRAGIGAVSEEERRRQLRWFSAIVATVSRGSELPDLDLDRVDDALVRAGLPADVARRVSEQGGSVSARRDVSPEGSLSLLESAGVDLADLDRRLRAADPFDGLTIDVAQRRLSSWIRLNRRRIAAILGQRRPPEEAKALPDSWKAPPNLRLQLDPVAAQWLGPVIDSLRASRFEPHAEALAHDPVSECVRIAALSDSAELETLVARLYDREEQRRILRASAAAWRVELVFLGILVRTNQGDSRSAIRAQADTVEELVPVAPVSPEALRPALDELFALHPSLADALSELMTDVLSALPERASLMALAGEHGIETNHRDSVDRALGGPKRELARKLRNQIAELKAQSVRARLPEGLQGADGTKPAPKSARKNVPAIKVSPSTDARKRRLGDEGERWALAAVLSEITPLDVAQRRTAIESIVALLDNFEGAPVEKARSHAEPACEAELDEEELIDELTELLHVSRHSDGFGFDLLGWLSPAPEAQPIALCVEVKSTRDGTFHLSRGEWERAAWFHERGEGDRYAILVVHRSSGSAPPNRLDLLADPVHLVATGQLAKTDDSYKLAYHAA